MCRFLVYRGAPVFLERLVSAPTHSLIHQSQHANEAKTETNGDGFGIGWYGERPTPGLYREILPAWSDENLRSLCAQVRSALFFAHVRAATGTATTRSNCHPFSHDKWLFMHNGQIGRWPLVRRRVESLIPDALYDHRTGSTDSEAIFLIAMAHGAAEDPVGGLSRALGAVVSIMQRACIREPLRLTAALSDGERVYAFRWSSDAHPPTLYWREDANGLVIVSEPIDEQHDGWQIVPAGHALIAEPGTAVRLAPFVPLVPENKEAAD